MPDVIFEEPKITQRQREEMRETSTFANWLMARGFAKNEKEAVLILLGLVVIAVVISLFLIFSGGTASVPPPSDVGSGIDSTI